MGMPRAEINTSMASVVWYHNSKDVTESRKREKALRDLFKCLKEECDVSDDSFMIDICKAELNRACSNWVQTHHAPRACCENPVRNEHGRCTSGKETSEAHDYRANYEHYNVKEWGFTDLSPSGI